MRRPRAALLLLVGASALAATACSVLPHAAGGGSARSGVGVPATAPRVPSPAGATWRIAALGDSVTSGGPCGCTPFPQRYGRDLARVRGVRTVVTNLGRGGQTSSGLLHALRQPGSTVAAAVRGADIDLVTTGANDFGDQHGDVTSGRCLGGLRTDCISDELAGMQRNVASVIATIHQLRGSRPTAVLVTGYWNVFEDGAVARGSFPSIGVRATRRLTVLADDAIRRATRKSGATYVDLYAPFEGPQTHGDPTPLLGPDGDHPNAAGQQLIADRLVAAGLPGLVEG